MGNAQHLEDAITASGKKKGIWQTELAVLDRLFLRNLKTHLLLRI